MHRIQTEADVLDLMHAARALAVLAGWNEAGLLDALAQGPKRPSELPVDPRAFRVTAAVLSHLGVLVGDGEVYELSDAGRALLAAGQLPARRHLEVLGDLGRVVDVLREGGPVKDAAGVRQGTTGGVHPDDPERSRVFLDMLYRASERSAEQAYAWSRARLPPKAKILDLGGGHGRYARTFADAGHEATLLDLPVVVRMARERHGDALRYLEGDFLAGAELGGPWDLVFLSNVVHGQSMAENEALLGRVARALRPGGVVVLKDMFLDGLERDPARSVFFGLTMLFYTSAGRSYTLGEAASWFRAAGLEPLPVAVLDGFELVSARRPAS